MIRYQILEHFGSDEQAKDFGKSANFKKLEKRLTRAASRDPSVRTRDGNRDTASAASKMSKSNVSSKSSNKRK